MQLVEGLPTYGVHYYDVKDKGGIPWWLGLSFKGVCQYDQVDRVTPRKVTYTIMHVWDLRKEMTDV